MAAALGAGERLGLVVRRRGTPRARSGRARRARRGRSTRCRWSGPSAPSAPACSSRRPRSTRSSCTRSSWCRRRWRCARGRRAAGRRSSCSRSGRGSRQVAAVEDRRVARDEVAARRQRRSEPADPDAARARRRLRAVELDPDAMAAATDPPEGDAVGEALRAGEQDDVLRVAAVDRDRGDGGLAAGAAPAGAGRGRGDRKPRLGRAVRLERGLAPVVGEGGRRGEQHERCGREQAFSRARGSPTRRLHAGRLGPFLAGAQQAVAQRGLVLRARVPLRRVGQLVDRLQPEQLEEQRRRAVQHGAELRAAGLLDQAALDQRRRGRLRRDAADAGDLRAGDRLQVGDDRERLGLRGREPGRARAREQPPRGLLGVRVRARASSRRRARAARSRGPSSAAASARSPASTSSSETRSASASSSTGTGRARGTAAPRARAADHATASACGGAVLGAHGDRPERLAPAPSSASPRL